MGVLSTSRAYAQCQGWIAIPLLSGTDTAQRHNELAPSEQELLSFREGCVEHCKLSGSESFLGAGIQKTLLARLIKVWHPNSTGLEKILCFWERLMGLGCSRCPECGIGASKVKTKLGGE